MNVITLPGDGLPGEGNVGLRRFSPGTTLSTDILRWLASILVLGHTMELTETLTDKVNVLTMALDTRGNNETFLGSDVVHHELLHGSGVEVTDIVFETKARHSKGVVTVGSAEEHVLIVREGIVLAKMLMQVVRLLILGHRYVGSQDRSGFKGTIYHHLEHVSHVVLNAVTLEVGALLVVIHGHVTTGHLDHSVVDGLVGVLQGLKIGVLKGKHST